MTDLATILPPGSQITIIPCGRPQRRAVKVLTCSPGGLINVSKLIADEFNWPHSRNGVMPLPCNGPLDYVIASALYERLGYAVKLRRV